MCRTLSCTKRELNARMSNVELQEWWAWYCTEPWGEDRADWRMGILAASLVNLWLERKARRVQPGDFLPRFCEAAPATAAGRRLAVRRQHPQEMLALLRHGTQEVGGTVR
jgi:hypothetical protein